MRKRAELFQISPFSIFIKKGVCVEVGFKNQGQKLKESCTTLPGYFFVLRMGLSSTEEALLGPVQSQKVLPETQVFPWVLAVIKLPFPKCWGPLDSCLPRSTWLWLQQ